MPIERFDGVGRTLTMTDIEDVETRLGTKLPAEYVQFLCRNNGGEPKPNAFPGLREGEGGAIHFFHTVDGGPYDDLVGRSEFFHEMHDVPPNMLPIARTGTGDLVCIGTSAPVSG